MSLNKVIQNEVAQRLDEFWAELHRKNIQLWVDGSLLRYKAPKGEMTPEIIGFLRNRKEELISYLSAKADTLGRPGEDAHSIFYEPIPQAQPLIEATILPTAATPLTAEQLTVSPTAKPTALLRAATPLSYPLSSAQKRMFVLHQLNPMSTAYNLTQVLKLIGPVNRERLQAVIEKIIERHEILRTSFEIVDGSLRQRIFPTIDFTVEYAETDATGGVFATTQGAEAGETELEALIDQFIRPYDLKQPPLFRLKLVKLNRAQVTDTYLLLYDTHHIISDGVSLGIFTKEINELYAGRELPNVKAQYKDFTFWHNQLLKSDVIQHQKEKKDKHQRRPHIRLQKN